VRDERNKKQESLGVEVSPLMFLEFVNLVSYVIYPLAPRPLAPVRFSSVARRRLIVSTVKIVWPLGYRCEHCRPTSRKLPRLNPSPVSP
jgi:hypothetical protein